MPVMPGSLISNGGSFGSTPTSPIANVRDGGQLGFGPNLPNLDANTPLVLMPLQFTVLHAPSFLDFIPNGVAIFKALFENHLVSMDGLEFSHTMDTEGTPSGRDGQMQMVPVRHARSQITPTCVWPEKLGNLLWNFGKLWMNVMKDVDTQASSMAGVVPSGTILPPHVSSMFSADILATQFDTTMRPENIVDAFIMTNFFPTDIGSPDYRYNALESHRPDRSFTFTTIVQNNNNTVAVAKSIATLTNLHLVNYQDAIPAATSIESQLSNEGMVHTVSEFLSQFQNLDGVV